MTIFRDEGAAALYKGFVPKVLRLAPGGGVLLLVVEFTLDVFRKGASNTISNCNYGVTPSNGTIADDTLYLQPSVLLICNSNHSLFVWYRVVVIHWERSVVTCESMCVEDLT